MLLTRQKKVEDRMWRTSEERNSWVSGRREWCWSQRYLFRALGSINEIQWEKITGKLDTSNRRHSTIVIICWSNALLLNINFNLVTVIVLLKRWCFNFSLVSCLLLVTVLISIKKHYNICQLYLHKHILQQTWKTCFNLKHVTKHTMNTLNIKWTREVCRCFIEL